MNRDEAVKKIAREGYISIEHAEDLYDSIIPKPLVPQCVADWYEGNNGDLNGALFTMVRLWDEKSRNSDFYRWFRKNKEAFQILVNMHQYGYEVEEEKEKLYTVEIPNPKGITICLSRLYNGKIVMGYVYDKRWQNKEFMQLTEQEIREDFDWAWQWAKEVE